LDSRPCPLLPLFTKYVEEEKFSEVRIQDPA
jgi:hypothetical protein